MPSPSGPPNNRLSIPGCSTATYKQNAFDIVHAQVDRFREMYNGGILVTVKYPPGSSCHDNGSGNISGWMRL